MYESSFEFTLPDGSPHRVRRLCPADRASLERTFAQMSPNSRHQRYFGVKKALSEQDFADLTHCDNRDRVGIGIFELHGEAEGDCVAAGRVVRNGAGSSVGEIGLSVIDRMQNRGLGRHLIGALIAAAQEIGIASIHLHMKPENSGMQRLARRLAPQVRFARDGDFISTEIPVSALAADPA